MFVLKASSLAYRPKDKLSLGLSVISKYVFNDFCHKLIIRKSSTVNFVHEVGNLIRSKNNILSMVGAGLSTPSGIPDFRSKETGLYMNLQKYNLPFPEAIFDIHFFMMDPMPFYTLAQDLWPGIRYKPNIGHYLLRILNDQQKLVRLYTQNIDGLERLAGIPNDKLVEAHGTFSTASCTLCGKAHDPDIVKNCITEGHIPIICKINNCKGKVKPDIVFFGENLPDRFWNYKYDAEISDLLLVIGTSLEVYPFAGIADYVDKSIPRVLINKDCVGSFGTRPNDIILTGELTATVGNLIEDLNWTKELKELERSFSAYS